MHVMTILASVAGTFNLVCGGTSEMISGGKVEKSAYSIEYRIDLDQGIYCAGECKDTLKIAEISNTRLLLDSDDGKAPLFMRTTDAINRETGEHSSVVHMRPLSILTTRKGMCERHEFTGFTKPVTKF